MDPAGTSTILDPRRRALEGVRTADRILGSALGTLQFVGFLALALGYGLFAPISTVS
ncbi:hypothetical protein DB30_00646 [Enhygromyxa salina]|uniref:Uncharacterized protein n=1 Tax=Enhygromyxa salina TaxID=215803 RepID=A0A0C2D5B7_9BACT|nr:hypothetical protein [Enhygromyxa salina]KIG18361.1 hypothetical protein DB30_00646 [Enhygromyxa salina]